MALKNHNATIKLTKILNKLFPPWFFLVHKYLGVLPVNVWNSGLTFSPECAIVVITVGTLGVCLYVHFVMMYVLGNNLGTEAILSIANGTILIFGTYLMILSTVIKTKQGHLNTIVSSLIGIEERFFGKRLSNVHSMSSINLISSVSYVWLVCVIMPMTYIVINWFSIVSVLFLMCHLYGLTQALLFIRILLLLSEGFMRLNSLVRDCWFRLKHPPGGHPGATLKEITDTHRLLHKAAEDIGSFFEPQLLCLFSQYFMYIVVCFHLIVQEAAKANKSFLLLTTRICWFCYSSVLLILIAWGCNQVEYLARKTGFYMSCHLSLDLSPISRDLVKRTLLLVNSRKVEFSVFNLFHINLKVVTVMAGMVVTYLIVMMQLEQL